MRKINLAVIFGGQSKEHEVSVSSAQGVISALNKNKYRVMPIAITKKGNWLLGSKGREYLKLASTAAGQENGLSLKKSQSLVKTSQRNLINYAEGEIPKKKIDLVLPILHGPYGEDGRLQGMLDMLEIPYAFSGVLAQALGMNKPKAKALAKQAGVKVPDDLVLKKGEKYKLNQLVQKLPLVVKPAELGSSVGVAIVRSKKELAAGIKKAFEHGPEVLLEKYIPGREFTVTVMGQGLGQALPVIEIIPKISDFYDYKAKYEDGGSEHICPAKISKKITKELQASAQKTFAVIGCSDLARVDFLWDGQDAYFIDINTIPGMTPTSLAPEAARAAGLNFSQFLDRIIKGALKRS